MIDLFQNIEYNEQAKSTEPSKETDQMAMEVSKTPQVKFGAMHENK